jgi:hypothetical protein
MVSQLIVYIAQLVKSYSLFHQFWLGWGDFFLKSILTTFIESIIFRGGWDISEKWLELKFESQ